MPSTDEGFLQIAFIASQWGTCSRLKVGAVLVRDRRIISLGYNGSAMGEPHCPAFDEHLQPCEVSVHAEINAINNAARNGVSTLGSTLYCTHYPCRRCSPCLINAGIVRVVFDNYYGSTEHEDMFIRQGIEITYVR